MKGLDMEHKHLHVIMPDELHAAIEEYRWQNRIRSKNETVVKLLQYALEQLSQEKEDSK